MPAAAIDVTRKLWRTKKAKGNKDKSAYLFNHKALAKVFRAKMLEAITRERLTCPNAIPLEWVVDCKCVGTGEKALAYLGRYLYKGVIQEKDIVACRDGKVTFRYQNSKTKQMTLKTVPGVNFLQLILQHVLPKGFRRARNFGFLHPEQQTPDWLAAIPARRESESSPGMAEKTSRIQMPVLREHHENCQNAHSTSVLIRAPNANRLTKPEGTSYVRPSLTTAA